MQANPQISVIIGGNEDLEPETSKSWVLGAVWSPSFLPRFSVEVNWYDIKIDGAIQAVDAEVTLDHCVVNNDPAACALVTRRVERQSHSDLGPAPEYRGDRDQGHRPQPRLSDRETGFGTFGFTWNNTFLLNYDVIVPTTGRHRSHQPRGNRAGQPAQAFPKWKSIGIIDWDWHQLRRVADRPLHQRASTEAQTATSMDSRFYTDLQLRWSRRASPTSSASRSASTTCSTKDPPGCFSCGLNNFDPSTYDVPGRYLYARATVKM